MSWRSTLLIVILGFALLFPMLYYGSTTDIEMPTKPFISKREAFLRLSYSLVIEVA